MGYLLPVYIVNPPLVGFFSSFTSFLPCKYKFGLVYSLLYRCFTIYSDFSKFHWEVNSLKNILTINGNHCSFIDLCIKNFLNKLYKPKSACITAPKKEIIIVLPFLDSLSLQIRTRLRRLIKNNLPQCNLKTIFRSNCRVQSLFQFKDRIPKYLHSGLVYKFTCDSRNAIYYGKTLR